MKPHPCHRAACLAALLILTITAPIAQGFLRRGADDSLEWMTADSDLIVRGTRLDGKLIKIAGWNCELTTLRVTETLKGKAEGTITILSFGQTGLGGHGDYLVFLVPTARWQASTPTTAEESRILSQVPWSTRSYWRYPIALDEMPNERVPHRFGFNAKYEELPTAEALLAVVRDEVRHPPIEQYGVLELQITPTSRFFAPETPASFGQRYLNILIEPRIAARAMEWVKSPDVYDRWNGAMVLSKFQSATNIALMKNLLDDPFPTPTSFPPSGRYSLSGVGKWTGTSYPIRRIAFDALRAWEVPIPEVVLEKPAYPVTYLKRGVVISVLATLITLCLILLLYRSGKGRRLSTKLAWMSAAALLILTAFWIRGHWRIDEISFSTAPDRRYEIAFYGGHLRLLQMDKLDERPPIAWTTVTRDTASETAWTPQGGNPRFNSLPLSVRKGAFGFIAERGTLFGVDFAQRPYRFWIIPLWSLCLLAAMLPAIKLRSWMRRSRIPEGHCQTCGYDLRASPERCPECGTAKKAATTAPHAGIIGR